MCWFFLFFVFSSFDLKRFSKNANYKVRNLIFNLKWQNEFQKTLLIFQFWLLNEKRKTKTIFFLNLFWFKTNFKKLKSKFSHSFFDWNQKMNFKKFFHFSILVMKTKNEKWKIFKIRFVFKSKNELYFRYTAVRVYFVHSIFNRIFSLKINLYPNFQFNLVSNSLVRFWILKNKSIMKKKLWNNEIMK